MQDIDFLPQEYRQTHESRRNRVWGALVVCLFLGLLGTLAFAQYRRWANVTSELAEANTRQEVSLAQAQQLATMRVQLKSLETKAELLTYLRHPWPRTQILHAALDPLPASITLTDFEIHRAPQSIAVPGTSAQPKGRGRNTETGSEEKPKLSPAEADLDRLRTEFDQTPVLVSISGITTDHLLLHRYLTELGEQTLFDTFELQSIEELPNRNDMAFKFRAIGKLVPGYGQPGSPQPPKVDDQPQVADDSLLFRVSQFSARRHGAEP